ncbi:hypothetical protein HQ520_08885 [bacterium]|nr:hypothetical protein [bacterium]
MIKPLFAQGISHQTLLAQAEPSGVSTLRVTGPEGFSVGQHVFCCESDGSELEYAGCVTAVDLDAVSVHLPLLQGKQSGGLVWSAESVFQWQRISAGPLHRSFQEGIRSEHSVGGAVWSVRTGDPWREDELCFRGLLRSHFVAFRQWLTENVRGGLDDFTWVDEARDVARVRLTNTEFLQVEQVPRVIELRLKLAVLEEGGYA